MNAINELKAMLDERGVKHRDNIYSCNTQWMSLKRGAAYASQCKHDESLLELTAYTVTPQQAIDATLGREECEDMGTDRFVCSKCGCTLDIEDAASCEPTMWVDGVAACPRFCPHCGRKVKQ